uniref:Kinocilin n=1 Tax=Poecilia mexicana TaxID=48701 RepID=A0A3B3YHI4_9TELE
MDLVQLCISSFAFVDLLLYICGSLGSALFAIVAGCIIIGVSRECDADAVGGIFLGAGGLGLLISIYPFIKAWLNINNILPSFGKFFFFKPDID